jgi:hypothetical protein
MLNIPSGIFDTYQEGAYWMLSLSGFGTPCKLVYAAVSEGASVPVSPLKKQLTMRPGGNNPYNREAAQKAVETTEDITLRVYWSEKDFKKIGHVNVPDGGIMTIGTYDDLLKIQKCNALLVHTNKDHVPWRFEKLAEPFLFGLKRQNSICYWRRS